MSSNSSSRSGCAAERRKKNLPPHQVMLQEERLLQRNRERFAAAATTAAGCLTSSSGSLIGAEPEWEPEPHPQPEPESGTASNENYVTVLLGPQICKSSPRDVTVWIDRRDSWAKPPPPLNLICEHDCAIFVEWPYYGVRSGCPGKVVVMDAPMFVCAAKHASWNSSENPQLIRTLYLSSSSICSYIQTRQWSRDATNCCSSRGSRCAMHSIARKWCPHVRQSILNLHASTIMSSVSGRSSRTKESASSKSNEKIFACYRNWATSWAASVWTTCGWSPDPSKTSSPIYNKN